MPPPLLVQSQLQALETGLKNIRHSQLLHQPEMKTMFTAIEKHHRDVKLAHLTGRTKDLIRQAEQDTKFYYILIRMIGEVLHSNNCQQREHLRAVYKWYKENKHVLNTGPRFGVKKKVMLNRHLSYDSLEASFEKLVREFNTEPKDLKAEHFGSEYSENKENFEAEDKEIMEEDLEQTRPHTVPVMERRQPSKSSDPPPADSVEHLLLKRKTVPLSHLFNPHARHVTEGDEKLPENTPNTEVTSPVKLKIGKGASVSGQNDAKLNHKKKWDAFQHEYNYGQDVLSKLQHIGRSGIPGGVRYTAHDHGLMAEDFTRDIVEGYMEYENIKSLYDGQLKELSPRSKNQLTEAKLEQFYDLASKCYSAKLPKYPSFSKTRAKSAPIVQRPKSGKKRVLSAKLGAKVLESVGQKAALEDQGNLPHTKPTEQDEVDVKLDIVVNMIDSVTEEMAYYKEKLAPEPQAGFRQPTVTVDPAQRPHTAPAGTVARPTSPEDYYYSSECMIQRELQAARGYLIETPQIAPNTVHFRPDLLTARSSAIEAIDWRGKITPDYSRFRTDADSVSIQQTDSTRWSTTPLGSHTYAKKLPLMKSSLRTSGSTHAGYRPRTAPTPTLLQARDMDKGDQSVNHQVDLGALHEVIQVQHLGGRRKRKKRSKYLQLNYEYFLDKDTRTTSCPSAGQEGPVMEYVSISTPKSLKGDHKSASLIKSIQEGDNDIYGESGAMTIPSAIQSHGGNDDDNSMKQGEREEPNMADFDEGEQDGMHHSDTGLLKDQTVDEDDIRQQNNVTGEEVDDNQKLLDDIRKLLERDSLRDEEVTSLSPGGSQCEFPLEPSDNQSGSFTSAPQRFPLGGEQQGSDETKSAEKPKQKQPLSKSTYWSYIPELGLSDQDLDEHVHDAERDFGPSSPHHRPKTRLGRAFPRAPSAPAHDEGSQIESTLTVEGVGTGMRSRSAGTVPAKAKNTDRHMVLIRQKEMLRKCSAKVYRTAPSIPSPFNPYGTRSPRQGTLYSSELEMHATKDSSPRHYLQKVGHLRSDDSKQDDNNYAVEMRPLTSAIKVMRMRPKGQRETPSPMMEYALQGHPGTPVESVGDEVGSGIRHYINNQSSPTNASTRKKMQDEAKQRYIDTGRPIPDYLEHVEPEDYYSAVEMQRRAKAAVNIQRIFRGYVARNWYRYLQHEYREQMENRQQAAREIQKAYRRHLACKKAIARRPPNPETIAWARNYKAKLIEKQAERDQKAQAIAVEIAKKKAAADAKLAIIGPHVEVYSPFHPKPTGIEKCVLNAAATAIQRHIRGWLVRMKLARLKRKSMMHGGSWNNFVRSYRDLIFKIQRRLGIERPKFYFSFDIISNFMDTKNRYESVFDKKAFSSELEVDELLSFFHECGLFPGQMEIQEAMTAMFKGQHKKTNLQKQQVIELAFQIYPPKGTAIPTNRQSTWMTPIIDGEEATKLIGTDGVEPTDFTTCWNLVSSSHRQRALEEQHRQAALHEEQWNEMYAVQSTSRKSNEPEMKQTLKPPQVPVIPEEDESSVQESQKSTEQENGSSAQDESKQEMAADHCKKGDPKSV